MPLKPKPQESKYAQLETDTIQLQNSLRLVLPDPILVSRELQPDVLATIELLPKIAQPIKVRAPTQALRFCFRGAAAALEEGGRMTLFVSLKHELPCAEKHDCRYDNPKNGILIFEP